MQNTSYLIYGCGCKISSSLNAHFFNKEQERIKKIYCAECQRKYEDATGDTGYYRDVDFKKIYDSQYISDISDIADEQSYTRDCFEYLYKHKGIKRQKVTINSNAVRKIRKNDEYEWEFVKKINRDLEAIVINDRQLEEIKKFPCISISVNASGIYRIERRGDWDTVYWDFSGANKYGDNKIADVYYIVIDNTIEKFVRFSREIQDIEVFQKALELYNKYYYQNLIFFIRLSTQAYVSFYETQKNNSRGMKNIEKQWEDYKNKFANYEERKKIRKKVIDSKSF